MKANHTFTVFKIMLCYTIHSPNFWPTALFHLIKTIPALLRGRPVNLEDSLSMHQEDWGLRKQVTCLEMCP